MHKSYCFKQSAKILKILHLVKHPICWFALYAFGNEWICVLVLIYGNDDSFHLQYRSLKERISENAHVLGSLERVWSGSTLLSEKQLATLPRHYSRMWVFRRCLVDGVLYHSLSYKRVVARNDFTVEFQDMEGRTSYGTVETYVKVQEKCLKAMCSDGKCCCTLASQYFAIVEVLQQDDEQLPKYRERTVVSHITRVKTSNRYMVVILILDMTLLWCQFTVMFFSCKILIIIIISHRITLITCWSLPKSLICNCRYLCS